MIIRPYLSPCYPTTPSSASHANLLAKLRVISANPTNLFISSTPMKTKLRLQTYILTWPGFSPKQVGHCYSQEFLIGRHPSLMKQALDAINWEAERGVHLLSSSSSPYPFQDLPSLMILISDALGGRLLEFLASSTGMNASGKYRPP